MLLPCLFVDLAPERSRYDARRLAECQSLTADKVVHYVCDDLGVGLKIAFVAEHLDEAAVLVLWRKHTNL